ncbi:hypothetical protein GCM10028864_27760 [Microlunatus parietis]
MINACPSTLAQNLCSPLRQRSDRRLVRGEQPFDGFVAHPDQATQSQPDLGRDRLTEPGSA